MATRAAKAGVSRSISASAISGLTVATPRAFEPNRTIASSVQALSNAYALGCTTTRRDSPNCRCTAR